MEMLDSTVFYLQKLRGNLQINLKSPAWEDSRTSVLCVCVVCVCVCSGCGVFTFLLWQKAQIHETVDHWPLGGTVGPQYAGGPGRGGESPWGGQL